MNILTIIIIAVFALCTFSGYKKGFLKTAFSLVSWLIVLILCNFATPIVTDLLVQHTDIEVIVHDTVHKNIMNFAVQMEENNGVADLEAALPSELKAVLLGEYESIAELMLSSTNLDLTPVVNGIVGVLGFVITVILLRITMVVIEFLLDIVSKLPLIGPMDKVLGIACGAGKGLIWCWVILSVVSILALTGTNTELVAYIAQSKLLTWLQNNNLLLNLITKL